MPTPRQGRSGDGTDGGEQGVGGAAGVDDIGEASSEEEDEGMAQEEARGAVVLPSPVLVDTVLVTAYLRREERVVYATSDR